MGAGCPKIARSISTRRRVSGSAATAWSMASAPSAPSMPWQRVVHSMEGSPNDAVLLLTSKTYQASGEQQQAMVIREVCPECKSARYKKNGHLHKPTAPRV